MSDVQPLSWRKIILCAIVAIPISLAISYGIGILALFLLQKSSLEEAFYGISALSGICLMVVAYLPLATLAGFLLGLFSTRYRKLAHALLSALGSLLLSILVAAVLLAWG